jgi:uncharacterized protein YtpQ (UPF0354 family)
MSPFACSLPMVTRRAWMTGATSAVILGGAIHTGLAEEATSLQQFRDEVVATLRVRRPNLRLTLPDNPLVVQVDRHEVYLANLFQDCVGQPREKREAQIVNLFDEMLAGFAEPEVKTFEAARPRLRARIVSAEVAANATGRLALVVRPFSAKARTVYVIDSPTTMAYVSLNTLAEWSVTAEAIHAPSIDNLDAISRDLPIEKWTPVSGSGVYAAIQGGDGYAAARLLAPKFMARMAEELGPELFVSVPQRDLLLAWSVDCSDKRRLAEGTAHYASICSRRITDEIFVWSQEGLRPANPLELVDHGRN